MPSKDELRLPYKTLNSVRQQTTKKLLSLKNNAFCFVKHFFSDNNLHGKKRAVSLHHQNKNGPFV